MKRYVSDGVPLLPAEDIAQRHGVTLETFRNWKAMGLVEPHTADGLTLYREDAMDALLNPVRDPVVPVMWVKPGQAAHILGRSTETLRKYADQGLVTRDQLGLYDLATVRALRDRIEHAKAD